MHYYTDYSYFIYVLPALIIALFAQYKIKSAYRKYSRINSRKNITGSQAARMVLSANGISDVNIVSINGELTDNYNPKTNTISLSDNVYNSTSIAAIGVACHEAGHACQHAFGYAPIKIRNAFIPVCNIGSKVGIPLALIGLFFSIPGFVTIGICLYAAVLAFQIMTLPVEFNASKRALSVIEENGILTTDNELIGAKKVLTSAAMTYVAAVLVSLGNVLRLISVSSRRK